MIKLEEFKLKYFKSRNINKPDDLKNFFNFFYFKNFKILKIFKFSLVAGSFASFAAALYIWLLVSYEGILVHILEFNIIDITAKIIFEIDMFSAITAALIAYALFFGAALWAFSDEDERLEKIEKNEIIKLLKFILCYFAMTAGALLLVYSSDLFDMFIFWKVCSLACIGVFVARSGDKHESAEAAYKYILIWGVSLALLGLGIAILWARYGTLNMAAVAQNIVFGKGEKTAAVLIVCAFLAAAGVFPMHFWYTHVMGGAPCAFIACTSAAFYCLFRICCTVFAGALGATAIPWALIIAGCATLITGVTMALTQDRASKIIAYHMTGLGGCVILGLGVALLAGDDPILAAEYGFNALQGGFYMLVNYVLCGTLLTLGNKPIFALGALCAVGIPPLGGFAAKLFLYESSFAVHPAIAIIVIVSSFLALTSFITVYNILPDAKPKNIPQALGAGIIIVMSLFPSWAVQNIIAAPCAALIDKGGYIIALLGALP